VLGPVITIPFCWWQNANLQGVGGKAERGWAKLVKH
jgi:hypothetical protein